MVDRISSFFQVRNSPAQQFDRSVLTFERRRVHASIFSLPLLHSTVVAHLLSLPSCSEYRWRIGLPLLLGTLLASFLTFLRSIKPTPQSSLNNSNRLIVSQAHVDRYQPSGRFLGRTSSTTTSALPRRSSGSSHRALWLYFGTIIDCGGGIE
jgi:hypothetical protein